MKAYRLYAVNDLRYEEVSIPQPPPGWVLVKVKASGICSSDIPRITQKGTYHFPTIPGHEFSGIVEGVGTPQDSFLIGQHVGVFPLIPCRHCPQCDEKHYEMCDHYDYIGSRRDGAFAEFVIVPKWNLLFFEKSIPFTTAAMLEPLAVALHAMRMADINSHHRVGIIGTGMIGISAAQWAKFMGSSDVTVIGRSRDKQELIENCNLTYLDISDKKSIGQYDIVLEAVGSPTAIEQAIYAVSPGGTLILMGNPPGNIFFTQDAYWRILRKQLHIVGTWNSAYDGSHASDWTTVVDALTSRQLLVEPLITHIFPQDRLSEGLQLMKDHRESYCKIMTIWNEK